MRLSVVLGALALFLFPTQSQAAWDIFQSYVIIDDGIQEVYFAGGINSDAAASTFAGTDLGDFTATDALTLNGGELKTYKNGSSNVCGGTLHYRVYASGDAPGAFTALALPFSADLGGGDQQWAASGAGIDLLGALTPGDYTLELYWEAEGNDGDPAGCGEQKYDSNFGNNFTATFSIVVPGCTDPDYQEYDAAATTDDGSCATLMGCTDPAYIQYDANAVVDNGSCVHLIDPNCASPTFDGHTYDVVQIGGQCWFSENLQTTVYANGNAIPGELDDATWSGTTEGAQDIHSGDPANLTQFGRLYNWHAVQDARSICPTGWEMPSDADWNTLTAEVGPNPTAQLKSANFWNDPSSAGTDDYGFDARPGGYRFSSGSYFGTGTFGDYWSTTTWRQFNSTSELASSSVGTVYAEHGFSVRCLRGPDVMGCMDPLYNEYDPTATIDDGSCATLYDPCENALVLGSIEVDLSTTTLTAEDGSATLTVTTGTPTSLTLSGINGAPDYTIAQPGAIGGLATGYYTVTATDANGCTSNSLQLVIPYSLCCDCGVYDEDSDGLCDDVDNCTDKTATNFADPANGACTY